MQPDLSDLQRDRDPNLPMWRLFDEEGAAWRRYPTVHVSRSPTVWSRASAAWFIALLLGLMLAPLVFALLSPRLYLSLY